MGRSKSSICARSTAGAAVPERRDGEQSDIELETFPAIKDPAHRAELAMNRHVMPGHDGSR